MLSIELEKIAGSEVQNFLFEQFDKDIPSLQFRHSEMFDLPFRLIAEQLNARKKISTKLPLFWATKGIVYPPQTNLEQSSSEATGNFKTLIIKNEIKKSKLMLADLTGGFGVDSFFLNQVSQSVTYVEPNAELLNIAKHNHKILGSLNITYHQKMAEEFLNQNSKHYDLIYLDPSRRDAKAKKVFRLSDCQPDIKKLMHRLFEFTDFVLIKTSPLLDIQKGLIELENVKKIFVVSVDNECKELLFLLQKGNLNEPSIETYNLDRVGGIKQAFSFTLNEEKNSLSDLGEPQTYLYEPNSSILKSGAFKSIGQKFGLKKLHINTHLYSSDLLVENFPGRIFKIEKMDFDRKNLNDNQANIITRNYSLKPEELKKKLKLSDGGQNYVIGFSGIKKKYVVLATRLA
jgi:hypothetical protein